MRMLLNEKVIKNSILKGGIAAVLLLSLYFAIITFVSGWDFALAQFSKFWYFIITLAVGFGIQIGLYSYLRLMIKDVSPKVVATSGVTSTAAMISCCSHYLVNLVPIIGITGFVTIVSQYQIQFFYVGLFFNFLGIVYMLKRLNNFLKDTAKVLP